MLSKYFCSIVRFGSGQRTSMPLHFKQIIVNTPATVRFGSAQRTSLPLHFKQTIVTQTCHCRLSGAEANSAAIPFKQIIANHTRHRALSGAEAHIILNNPPQNCLQSQGRKISNMLDILRRKDFISDKM
jgi:hypothetical protein